MGMHARHTEFFGPDLARGPFSSQRIETSALQIATAIAQLRTPLTRSDDDLFAHADFIRQLADRLAPDWAAWLTFAVGAKVGTTITTTIRSALPAVSIVDLWLADGFGQGLTSVTPASVTFTSGTVLQAVVANKWWRVITPSTGIVTVNVVFAGVWTWKWAASRGGVVYYSYDLAF